MLGPNCVGGHCFSRPVDRAGLSPTVAEARYTREMPSIVIRELTSTDRRAVAFTFGHLSEHSRFQRFFMIKKELTPRDLSWLVNVDHWHHEALIAYSPPPRAPIGIARYVRLDEFDVAEVAVEVVDGWQRRGVGTALMSALYERAIRAGIRRVTMTMLRDNKGARALARKLVPPSQPATVLAAAGSMLELSYPLLAVVPYSPSGAGSGPDGGSDAGASPPPSPSPSAPTATGVGFGAGSITVSRTSPSPSPVPSPSGVPTRTVEPEGT